MHIYLFFDEKWRNPGGVASSFVDFVLNNIFIPLPSDQPSPFPSISFLNPLTFPHFLSLEYPHFTCNHQFNKQPLKGKSLEGHYLHFVGWQQLCINSCHLYLVLYYQERKFINKERVDNENSIPSTR